ncbi:MAG: hypothetical protein M1821_004140 [Bathelium mastoideum]|nr:MAG: hypothetical protein M1821_004140 [Bathelium mastoideum]
MGPPPPERATKSATPVPSTENPQEDGDSPISEDQWHAMQTVLDTVYNYRTKDGEDPSKVFHRKVNKRVLPAYYDVIKEPMALSMIKAKINAKEYKSFEDFVRDFALIPHNAQVFNRPDAGAYQDALIIKEVLESELKQVVATGTVSAEAGKLPFLGEIPPPDENPEQEEEEEEEEEEDEEEDEEAEDSDEGGKRKRKRGTRSTAAITKRETGTEKEDAKVTEAELRKRRGRPPRVDTPMEARIKNVMKGLRKPKNSHGQLKISHFERLPDKAVMPEYYNEIKNPIAFDVLKKKLKRKKYTTLEQFMKDVDVMFENAKSYNQDESQIYKDAVELQQEARALMDIEKAKPDTEYAMEEGRIPIPGGILHNGELWKVGDWVHIQNPNDLTKPIVAQIYRTWQDSEGQKWVNACWYYRPEQTVHRFDKHFYENEVVKTGQYRDHHIDEVVDRCFVMFFTRYNKGRPRNFPTDKEIYVCEARYNEEKFKLNKIKTWASCLPDEVRDKDYEMDLFDAPKKMKKVPSPIAYLLKDEAKETDDLPKPEWGAENAPPKIGAVHKRPRDPKDSPPPEPTPTPPPQPPPPPPKQPSRQPSKYATEPRSDSMMPAPAATAQMTAPSPSHSQGVRPSYPPTQYYGQSGSPAPPMPRVATPQTASFPPHTPSTDFTSAQPAPLNNYSTPQTNQNYSSQTSRVPPPALGYKTPQPMEVYCLNDAANLSIPQDIREQFHRDENGRILFYIAPPLDVLPATKPGAATGHSIQYLAARARRQEALREKRKREADEAADAAHATAAKKAKLEREGEVARAVGDLTRRAEEVLEQQLADATEREFRAMDPEGWQGLMERHLQGWEGVRGRVEERERILEAHRRARREKGTVALVGKGVLLDEVA